MSDELPKVHIHLSMDKIPEIREPMPVMKLGAPVLAPEKLIRDIVRVVAPGAEFKEIEKSGARGAYHKKRLVALVDPKSGESKVFPTLGILKPGAGLAERAKTVAAKIARESALFPEDGTEAVALEPLPLFGAKHHREKEGTKPAEYISYVRFQRRVNGVPVCGPGTRAMIGIAADGSVCALTHRWRKAIPTDEKMVARPREEIHKAIVEQLSQRVRNADVRVDTVDICYYDGGQNYLQPVYRYMATIKLHPPGQKIRCADAHLHGYIPIGIEREPIMQRGKMYLPPMPAKSNAERKSPPEGDPTVGRYIIQNDTAEWWISSCEFLNGLQTGGSQIGVQFTDSQYLWADPYEYEDGKNDYVNSVNIADTEGHGDWWLFETDAANGGTFVQLKDISGYGPALAYWIIHSCEVIPTQDDESTSFDVWWQIFNGLHAVVGYRTVMFIDDDVLGPFGFDIGSGASVVSAWLNEAITASSYQGDPGPKWCDCKHTNTWVPMGRPSAVVPDGHGDDTAAYDIDPLNPPSVLWEFWIGNLCDTPPCSGSDCASIEYRSCHEGN